MSEQEKVAIIDKGRLRAKKWLKKIKAKNIKNAKNSKELLCDEDLEDIQSSLFILGKSNKRYSQQEVETKLGLAN